MRLKPSKGDNHHREILSMTWNRFHTVARAPSFTTDRSRVPSVRSPRESEIFHRKARRAAASSRDLGCAPRPASLAHVARRRRGEQPDLLPSDLLVNLRRSLDSSGYAWALSERARW